MKPDALADELWNKIDLPTMDENSSDNLSISDLSGEIFMFDRPLDYDSSSEESSAVKEYFTRTVSQDYDNGSDEKMVQAVKPVVPVDEVGHQDFCAPSSPMKTKKAEIEEDLAPMKKTKHTSSNNEFKGGELPLKKRAISYKVDNDKEDDMLGRADGFQLHGGGRCNFDSAAVSLKPNDVNCSYLKTTPMPINPSVKNLFAASPSNNDGTSISLSKMTSVRVESPLKNVWVAPSPKAISNGTRIDLSKMTSVPVVTPLKKRDAVVIHENEEKGIRAPYPSLKNEINYSSPSNKMKCKGKNVVPAAPAAAEVVKEKVLAKSLPFRIDKASTRQTTSVTIPLPSKMATQDEKMKFTPGEKWLRMFRCLQAFKNQYGHTDVKQQYAPNPSLGIWVNTQRTVLSKWLESEGDKQTKNDIKKLCRVNSLKSIGFVFSIGKGRHGKRTRIIPEYNKKGWEDQFAELLNYKATYGNCSVRLLDPNHRSLGRWVGSQRKKYREYFIAQHLPWLHVGNDDEKKKRLEPITGDEELVLRFERLKDIGFDFVGRKKKLK